MALGRPWLLCGEMAWRGRVRQEADAVRPLTVLQARRLLLRRDVGFEQLLQRGEVVGPSQVLKMFLAAGLVGRELTPGAREAGLKACL